MKKVSHTEARYGSGSVKEHCSLCSMYRGVDDCTKVEAPIEPYGHCKYFYPKRKVKNHAVR